MRGECSMKNPQHEAQRWLKQAGVDLGAAQALSEPFPALACFHAQQTAEKALKAILYATGERPVLGHGVGELGGRVVKLDPEYEGLRREVAKLDRYYIATRYPNGLPEGADPGEAFDASDSKAAVEVAGRVLEHARVFIDNLA